MYSYTVKLNNVKIDAAHGVYDEEKKKEQPFEVDLKATFCRNQDCDDNLNNSLDYQRIYDIVVEVFSDYTFNLIESVAERIIEKVFLLESSMRRVEVSIRKPKVSLRNNRDCVEVTIVKLNE